MMLLLLLPFPHLTAPPFSPQPSSIPFPPPPTPLRCGIRSVMVGFACAPTSAATSKSPKSATKPSKPRTNNPFLKPQPLSPTLQSFLGVSELSRAETIKKVWVYIKQNNLQVFRSSKKLSSVQSENSKRVIICDEKLKALFGQDSLGMLEIPKLLNPHFLKQ